MGAVPSMRIRTGRQSASRANTRSKRLRMRLFGPARRGALCVNVFATCLRRFAAAHRIASLCLFRNWCGASPPATRGVCECLHARLYDPAHPMRAYSNVE